jgi:hypothetical protein
MASGRRHSAGTSTCSAKARNTAVLVAAGMLMLATMPPSSASAPMTVSRCQLPRGTLPVARRPRGARP